MNWITLWLKCIVSYLFRSASFWTVRGHSMSVRTCILTKLTRQLTNYPCNLKQKSYCKADFNPSHACQLYYYCMNIITSYVPVSWFVMLITEKSPFRSPLASIDTWPAIPVWQNVRNVRINQAKQSDIPKKTAAGVEKLGAQHRKSPPPTKIMLARSGRGGNFIPAPVFPDS